MDQLSFLSNADGAYIDHLYTTFRQDPASVDAQWRHFFEGFEFARATYGEPVPADGSSALIQKEILVLNLIAGYRQRGHLFAKINPILPRRVPTPSLHHSSFGLADADLDTVFVAGNQIGIGPAPLRKIIQHLEDTYCRSIGVEYKYIRGPRMLEWLEQRMESSKNATPFSADEKKHILRKLAQASFFEGFLHRKFVGQKRFSLEGAESLIPALDGTISNGANLGIEEFVIGMAHRGRLNVLTNILQKEYDNVFSEFVGKGIADDVFDGDVKYHLGHSSDVTLPSGRKVHLSLAPNPSHLETVDPVVTGIARAKMDQLYGGDHDKICPILIHGDAALAGQGVVYELIQMSRLPGYEVGGTIHIVVNNQVGFTTNEEDARSSTYCTDVAKVTLSPVFHVNGDDPEALLHVTKLAIEFRQEFNRDVFIDIVCYRKYGHNEGDEPRFTQPRMYAAIDKHKSPYQVYIDKLLAEGSIDASFQKQLEDELNAYLNKEFEESKEFAHEIDTHLRRNWEKIKFYSKDDVEPNPHTAVDRAVIDLLADRLTTLPEGFVPHRNVAKLLETRKKMVTETNKIDWGMGEILAYGSLLNQGHIVRISGQDVERGTFSHRHAVVVDVEKEDQPKFSPLRNIREGQAPFYIYNSLLSEYAVMGFEYGYAFAAPDSLVIWEAQFGDFNNGAQIIIDQFLVASKTKWARMNGLVLLLPHGFEGQGPEHSSARMERFLQLTAENNMYVCDITTPANLFHALRRQVLADTRRPLVVFSPKSLLRLPACVSPVEDFINGGFQELIDDSAIDTKKVKRVVFCTGKLYYDLLEQRNKQSKLDTAIVRLEQLYPLPYDQIEAVLKKYGKNKQYIWAQEEPENMGAWTHILRKLRHIPFELVSRKEAASPATGSTSQHAKQQDYIIKKALDLAPETVLIAG